MAVDYNYKIEKLAKIIIHIKCTGNHYKEYRGLIIYKGLALKNTFTINNVITSSHPEDFEYYVEMPTFDDIMI